MVFQLKPLIIFLLLMISIFSGSCAKKFHCDPENRPQNSQCFPEGFTVKNLCAYYKEDCPFNVCGQPALNECQACSDPKVLYYQEGDCKPEEMVSKCYEDICNPDFDPQQGKVFEPVCGFTKDCNKGDCSQTFENVCQACQTKGYNWYQVGVCKDDRIYCDSKKKCRTPQDPVCAFFDSQDGGVLVHTTANSAITACKDPEVDFYTKGACGPSRDNIIYCLPTYRPQACTRDYKPVCGFYIGQNNEIQHKVMSNACTACADPTIIYHKPGACVFTCDRNPFVVYDCDGTRVEPICGSYQEGDETKQISLKNSCTGCYDIPIKIDSYTYGLCPGDEGIRCENDSGGFLVGRISPVCGVFKEGCTESDCQQTFAEPVAACSDPTVILFKPGMCPGDEGISCNPYRQPSDGFSSSLIYNDVCGYSQKGCTDSSCRATYTDQNEACGSASVLFFTEGPCA